MAQFRGIVKGNRSSASRLGYKTSGLNTVCNGWNVGVTCVASHNEKSGLDEIAIYRTGGSTGGDRTTLVAIVTDK